MSTIPCIPIEEIVSLLRLHVNLYVLNELVVKSHVWPESGFQLRSNMLVEILAIPWLEVQLVAESIAHLVG
jgi:hypothetical protein